ncbi:MAG: DUF123 domain-containing protein [Halobacteriaceae archaeon]
MESGTYVLLARVPRPLTVEVGALGDRDFEGWYAYVGSALGPGGFSRVERHRELAAGERDARHWHVDYLLGHPAVELVGDVRAAGADAECAVAGRLADDFAAVPGFGASDCACESHLFGAGGREAALRAAVEAAHESVR